MQNKEGLSRAISPEIKRKIRQRSKFGCVICRRLPYEYEHIDPEFKDAKEHDPDKMCLLCGCCHAKVTGGTLSKDTVKRRYESIQRDEEITPPFGEFDLDHQNITVTLGSCIFHNAKKLIVLNNELVLAIEPPEEGSSFPLLSGYFSDSDGNELMRIEKNEWKGPSMAWDLTYEGRDIKILSEKRKIALHIQLNPPNEIKVLALDMRVGNSHLILTEDGLCVGRISPECEYYIKIGRMECFMADRGVSVDETITKPHFEQLRIAGGEGIDLQGTGIKVGVGALTATVRDILIEEATKQKTIVTKMPLRTDIFPTTEIFPPRI